MTDVDFFGRSAEQMERNAQMNQRIIGAAHRGEQTSGGVARLSGQVTRKSEEMNQVLDALKRAEGRGDEEDQAFLEHKLDSLIEESRAARQEAQDERFRDPNTGQFITASDFDGGVRRAPGQSRPTPGAYPESSNQLFCRMVSASHQARRERGQEHTITTNT
jgi:hypothetical protein